VITKDPITPQICCHTTSWNTVSCRQSGLQSYSSIRKLLYFWWDL